MERLNLSYPGCEPRGAIDVLLDWRGKRLRVIATHLGLRPIERRHQIQLLLNHLGEWEECPVVFMGDLNEWFLWGRPLRWLRKVFDPIPSQATFPSRFPFLPLDRIWMKPRRMLGEVDRFSHPLSRMASDHLPVKAIIELDGSEYS